MTLANAILMTSQDALLELPLVIIVAVIALSKPAYQWLSNHERRQNLEEPSLDLSRAAGGSARANAHPVNLFL
jgi:hypothetical protein